MRGLSLKPYIFLARKPQRIIKVARVILFAKLVRDPVKYRSNNESYRSYSLFILRKPSAHSKQTSLSIHWFVMESGVFVEWTDNGQCLHLLRIQETVYTPENIFGSEMVSVRANTMLDHGICQVSLIIILLRSLRMLNKCQNLIENIQTLYTWSLEALQKLILHVTFSKTCCPILECL